MRDWLRQPASRGTHLAAGLLAAAIGWAGGYVVGSAEAAPLAVHGRQANLYGGKLGTARACVDLRLKKPTTVRLEVSGARQFSDYSPQVDSSWAGHKTLRLRAGHRHFCRWFSVRYWSLATSVKLAWRAETFNAVHARLFVGGREWRQTSLLKGETAFPLGVDG